MMAWKGEMFNFWGEMFNFWGEISGKPTISNRKQVPSVNSISDQNLGWLGHIGAEKLLS